jgi:hypothetical protein
MSARTVGGQLDLAALARLHFHSLSVEERTAAIHRMASDGHGAHTIAHATGLSVEMIRRIIGETNTREALL